MFTSARQPINFFEELHPSLQKVFEKPENASLTKLKEIAGFKADASVSQFELIKALKEKGITASVTDMAKISCLASLYEEDDLHISNFSSYSKP